MLATYDRNTGVFTPTDKRTSLFGSAGLQMTDLTANDTGTVTGHTYNDDDARDGDGGNRTQGKQLRVRIIVHGE